MIFTQEQIGQFREKGYVIVPKFFNQTEVEAMQAEIDRFKREGLLRNVTTEGDGKTKSADKLNLQLCPMSPHSALFKTLPFAPKVVEAIRELIGDPVILHLDQVFLKPAKHGIGTNWHQDNAYFKIDDPLKGTAMWIAVHDATIENGTMRVIPGVHHQQFEHTRDPFSDHHIRCYPPEEKAEYAILKAGGAVFFAYGVPHATGSNDTDSDRAGAAFHFLNGNHIPEGYFGVEPNSIGHPALSGPKADGGVSTYGENLSQAWDRTVEDARLQPAS